MLTIIEKTISIQKTANRRVVGSQNDLMYMATAFPEDFNQINETPMSILGTSPDRALIKAVEAYKPSTT